MSDLEDMLLMFVARQIEQFTQHAMLPLDDLHRLVVTQNLETTQQVTAKYRNFCEQLGLVFENESIFESSQGGLIYREPSYVNPAFFYLLNEHYGCGTQFDSAEALRDKMRQLLTGKRVLEIGCGPGFLLPVLADLGVEPVGLEDCTKYKGSLPAVNITYGDAEFHLAKIEGEFDIIYSSDLLCRALMTQRKANAIMRASFHKTSQQGIGIHHVSMMYFSPMLQIWNKWFYVDRLKDKSLQETTTSYLELPRDARDELVYANDPHFYPEMLKAFGFQIEIDRLEDDLQQLLVQKGGGSSNKQR